MTIRVLLILFVVPLFTGCLRDPCRDGGAIVRDILSCESSMTAVSTADTSPKKDSAKTGDTAVANTGDTSADTGSPFEDPVEILRLSGGTFQMGEDNPAFDTDYEPVHPVTLSPFWMMKAPVTRQLYDSLMNDPPPSCGSCTNCPANFVTWYKAVEFANALSLSADLDPVYTITAGDPPVVTPDWEANGYRLPTEAEWEYAARGGETFPYAGSADPYEVGWFAGDAVECPQPVCSRKVNGFGLCDMSGNTSDWLWDWWGEDYYDVTPAVDPRGPADGISRSYRGGNWESAPLPLFVRAKNRPDSPFRWGSIRLVRRVE